jgi:hypothetical protein
LRLDNDPPFYSTARPVQNARVIAVEASTTLIVVWEEIDSAGETAPMFAVFPDGRTAARITQTSHAIELRYRSFDPLMGEPDIPAALCDGGDEPLFVIQFHSQVLPEFSAPLGERGAKILRFIPNNAVLARVQPQDIQRVRDIQFVRSVSVFHAAYRIEERFVAELTSAPESVAPRLYSAMLVDNAPQTILDAEGAIIGSGGVLIQTVVPTGRIEFRADGPQLLEILKVPDVMFVDFPGEPGLDMDRVRDYGGANQVELLGGFTGEDVCGEVMDYAFRATHAGFQTPTPPTIRGTYTSNQFVWGHGTAVYGIVFGDGTDDPCLPGTECGRGLLPDGRGIFASFVPFDYPPSQDRYVHTSQLVRVADCAGDPLCPYNAVFQTNSWGHAHRLEYTTVSAEMDQIVFDLDISICQSQGNCGRGEWLLCRSTGEDPNCYMERNCSRPEAWSKNVMSVGAIFDFPDEDHRNDVWCTAGPGIDAISCGNSACGSRGPAIDGRVKPDLVNFGDCIRTATSIPYSNSNIDYTSNFGGTSSSTPMTCGYAGLVFQMWHESVFNVWNGTTSVSTGGGASVFDDRPHAATVKAMLINTAYRYPLVTEPPLYRPDFTRDSMGWGIVDVAALYEQRNNMFIVNETDLLTLFGTRSYTYTVPTGSPTLRVTLVYADPPGIPNSTFNLVNDLSLKVVSPTGAVYWGNYGLRNCLACLADYFVGNWSVSSSLTPFPHKDQVNNVENVFIKNPTPGTWTITVSADSIIQDGHVETPALDADYALVVSSGDRPRGRCCQTVCTPSYHCTCSWTSRSACTGAGSVWTSDATCADDCTNV